MPDDMRTIGTTGAGSAEAPADDLSHREARFRMALAHSGVVVFEHDRELRYTFIYPTQFYDTSKVLGRTDAQLFDAMDAERLMALKRQVISTGVRVKQEVSVGQGGRRHEFVLTIEPLLDANGQVTGLTGASTNITAIKDVQAQLASALEFREQVMGILGHDLRNPLNAVVGSTQILLAAESAEHKRRSLLRIERSATRMAEMIGTLLDFARSRFHGALRVSPAEMNLADVMRTVADELSVTHPGRRIGLDVYGDSHGVWDAARLAQVGSNLIENALKHGAPDGEVSVRIRGERADAVTLEVKNDGPPIPEALIAELFKPFHRDRTWPEDGGHGEAATSRQGLGLGLYIADQIVRAHAGSIEVRSTRETGTIFLVRLPR